MNTNFSQGRHTRQGFSTANTERESFILSGEVDRYLIRLMEEMMHDNRRFNTGIPRYATETNETIVFMRYLRETMSEYNVNMTRFLDTMDSLENHISTHRINAQNINENRRRESRTADTQPTSGASTNRGTTPNTRLNTNHWRPIDPSFYNRIFGRYTTQQNVIVRPTTEQILNATEEITFEEPNVVNEEDDTRHSRCPITLEDFADGELVTRIRHCGHTFNRPAIANWFNTNVRCPVCRYDIRDWRPLDVSGNSIVDEFPDLIDNDSANTLNTLVNELTTGLNSAIQTYMNTEYNRDSITNYRLYPDTAVYTFSIPLNYQDASGQGGSSF